MWSAASAASNLLGEGGPDLGEKLHFELVLRYFWRGGWEQAKHTRWFQQQLLWIEGSAVAMV